jgi:predicted RNA binding protein YcfA (HicA-like mRNA interferase family)
MISVTGKIFAKVLVRHGWKLLRINVGHHIYGRAGSKVRISIPIHGNKNIKTGLLRHFLSMAGLKEDDL